MDCISKNHGNLADLSGKRFGRLLVLERSSAPGEIVRWACRCDCGADKSVRASKLVTGNTLSCGCLVAERRREFNLSRTEFTGQTFGRLTVTARTWVDGKMRWICKCSCGSERTASTAYLKSSKEPSCGCAESEAAAARRFVDLTGRRFGKLVVSAHVGFDEKRKALWRCTCDCGDTRTTRGNSLTSGRTISCGCAARDDSVHMTPKALAESAVKCAIRRARKRNAGGSFTVEQLQEVFRLQRYLCANCGKKLKLVGDHKVSLADGGSNEITNIEGLCQPCNHRKNAKDPIAWANENGRLI